MNYTRQVDLGEFLEQEIFPFLWSRLDTAFPDFGFVQKGNKWEATNETATRQLPGTPRPDRVHVYENTPFCLVIEGGDRISWLTYLGDGLTYPEKVRQLADLAGLSLPERQWTPEQQEAHQQREARRSILMDVIAHTHTVLLSPAGAAARAYLVQERGLCADAIEDLSLGLYPTVAEVRKALEQAGHTAEDLDKAAVLWDKLEGYILFPWMDDRGYPMTLYGRWPALAVPEGRPKAIALPGEGTKRSPLYFDRARAAGHKDAVLVEGCLDAAVLQSLGQTNVIACMAAQLSREQVETLKHNRIEAVTICLDPDPAGQRGVLSCVDSLHQAGIPSYVAPPLPDGLDPDEFVLREGLDAWRDHIDQAQPGTTYRAVTLLQDYDPGTDKGRREAGDTLLEYAAGLTDPRDVEDVLDLAVNKTGYTKDTLQEMYDQARARRQRDEVARQLQEIGRRLAAGDVEEGEALGVARGRLDCLQPQAAGEPVRSLAEELEAHENRLARWRGAEFIGLPQKTLSRLDEATLGLRGFMLLAAAPNVGKTALGVQLGVDVVECNEDACFLFLSLEMERWEIITRIKSCLAEMDWKTLVFGSGGDLGRGRGRDVYFKKEELDQLEVAEAKLATLGQRIRILDERNFPRPTVEMVLGQVADLKECTGTRRAFVLVDYLQVWPIPEEEEKHIRSELEGDKWRIGAMKTLRANLEEDAILAISEARKPAGGSKDSWGGEMADVMGAARGSYTPDMVFLFQTFSEKELAEVYGWQSEKPTDTEREGARKSMREEGISYNTLTIAKGRDGVLRDEIDLVFRYRQARFEEWEKRDRRY